MANKRKDVHVTGALAALLHSGDVSSIDDIKENRSTKHASLEIDQVKYAKDTAQAVETITEIDPQLCTPWHFADRTDSEMGDIDALAESIQSSGQLEPVLVRPIKAINQSHQLKKYEIIFGNRRWHACKFLNKQLKAIIRQIDDQTAALFQQDENENRKDISDYSKAIHYKKLVSEGVFKNESQLSKHLNIPRNRLNELMAYTRIPGGLANKIKEIHTLPLRMAIKLATLSKDPETLEHLIALAPDISSHKVTKANIQRKIEALENGLISQFKKSEPVIGQGGAEIFTVRTDSNGAPCIVFHKAARNAIDIKKISGLLKSYIDEQIGYKLKVSDASDKTQGGK